MDVARQREDGVARSVAQGEEAGALWAADEQTRPERGAEDAPC
jgi:hypothetical protein